MSANSHNFADASTLDSTPPPPVLRILGCSRTLSELARNTGISLPHVSRICNGERQPSVDYAYKLAREIGVSVDSLLAAIRSVQSGDGRLPISSS